MLHFSVPLAADIDATSQNGTTGIQSDGNRGLISAVVTGVAENDDDNDDNGTIMIDPRYRCWPKSAHPRREVGCQRRRWSRYRDS